MFFNDLKKQFQALFALPNQLAKTERSQNIANNLQSKLTDVGGINKPTQPTNDFIGEPKSSQFFGDLQQKFSLQNANSTPELNLNAGGLNPPSIAQSVIQAPLRAAGGVAKSAGSYPGPLQPYFQDVASHIDTLKRATSFYDKYKPTQSLSKQGEEIKQMLPKTAFFQDMSPSALGLANVMFDAVITRDVAKAVADPVVKGVVAGLNKLPDSVLYKIETSNIPSRDILDVLKGTGEGTPEAKKFVRDVIGRKDRKTLTSLVKEARRSENVTAISQGEPTLLGKLAGAEKTGQGVGFARNTPEEQLPGYRPINKQPSFGLSTQPVERVGGEGDISNILRGTKGMTAEDIQKTYPNIKLKKDVPVKDIYGNKTEIPEGEKLTPYELKGNKILLQDGETYIVSKNQFQNIKGQSVVAEGKPFAPELKGLEETVKTSDFLTAKDIKEVRQETSNFGEKRWVVEFNTGQKYIAQSSESKATAIANASNKSMRVKGKNTKFPQYTFPVGKNYSEVIHKDPRFPVKPDETHFGDAASWHRADEITYKGKKVYFVEEIQKGKHLDETIGHPLAKGKYIETEIKSGLKRAVDSNADIYAWINGEQTSARYNLGEKLDYAKWQTRYGVKQIELKPIDRGGTIDIEVDKDGVIVKSFHFEVGKKLDEVLGKGLADKIMEKESGNLSGEGLSFGGEWTRNLYDKQYKNIVEKLTGQKVEMLDMGLPIGRKIRLLTFPDARPLTPNNLKIGMEVAEPQRIGVDVYIVIDVLKDGKVRVIPKTRLLKSTGTMPDGTIKIDGQKMYFHTDEIITFDISQPTTKQMGIKLTPEVKARIKGEAPKIKTSGEKFEQAVAKPKETIEQTASKMKAEGKSFEEFLKEQPVVYHGGKKEITKIRDAKISTYADERGATFASADKQVAESFGKEITEIFPTFKKPLIVDAKKSNYFEIPIPKEIRKDVHPSMKTIDTDSIVEIAQERGHDGVIIKRVIEGAGEFDPSDARDLYIGLTKDSFKTKSQLKQIWDKADSESTKGITKKWQDARIFSNPEKTPLRNSQYAILTAENPGGKAISAAENIKRNALLEKELKEKGYKLIPVEGHYGTEEHSFIVPGMTDKEALYFGKKYGQESVLTPKGLIYGDKTVNPADLSKINFDGSQTDFYSKITIGGKEIKFSIPIDFDKKIPLDNITTPEPTKALVKVRGKNFELVGTPKRTGSLPKTRIKREIKKIQKEYKIKKETKEGKINRQEHIGRFNNFVNPDTIDKKSLDISNIATRTTKEGNKVPAIRKSGFYATKDIENADIRDVYKQSEAPQHMALMQDKYKLGGKFGTVFKKMWKPTKQAIVDMKRIKIKYDTEVKQIVKDNGIKITKKNGELISDYLENKKPTPEKYKKLVQDLRDFLDRQRKLANSVRTLMGKKKIGYLGDYIPHIQKATLWNELLSNRATISDNLDFIIPNQAKNPFAYTRMMDELPKAERNFFVLVDRYNSAISKDVILTPAIENLKAYNAILKDRGFIRSAKYWDEYIRNGLIGKQHKLDISLSIGQKGRKALQKWNAMVNQAFLTGKIAWNIATQPLSYITLTPTEAGFKNAAKAIYKATRKGLRKFAQENSLSLQIKSADVLADAVGEGRGVTNSIYKTPITKWNDAISVIGKVEEQVLHEASFIAGLDRARDLGYTGQDAIDFADLVAERSQSMYNKENRALILDSDAARAVFPFQSFAVEMWNHLKEITTSSSGAMKLEGRQRFGKLLRLVIGIYLGNLYAKSITGRKKTTVGTFVPFFGQFVDALISKTLNKELYSGRSQFTAIQQAEQLIQGSKDYLKYGDLYRLRKVGLNFGLAGLGIGGGAQINNLIDGVMADIKEEVRSSNDRRLFRVEDVVSKIKAPVFGVWSTKGGRNYWDKGKELSPEAMMRKYRPKTNPYSKYMPKGH